MFLSVILAVVLFAISTIPTAAAQTQSFELTTRSILLVDRSGSVEDREAVDAIVSKLETASFDAVGYFDTEVSADSAFAGGGNSSICEVIDQAADAGFTHITVITDGEQWPVDYSSLGIYSDLDLTIHLVEQSEAAEEFVGELEGRLANSSLKVVTPEGEKVVLDDYQVPVYAIELPDSKEGDTIVNEGDNYICNCDCCKCNHWSWWWLLLLLLPLLGFLIWWFFRNWKIAKKIKNSYAVVDCSNSMTKALAKLYRACRRLGVSRNAEIVRFGEGASIEELSFLKDVQGERCTHGTEGLEIAHAQGKEEIVLISDLGFNGKPLSTFQGHFKKISVVAPEGYSSTTLDELRKIADEVEVLHL